MERITKEQIEQWKKKHGEVFHIEFEDGKQCYLRKPDRKIAKLAQTKPDGISMAEVILTNCWLAGDEEIRQADHAGYHIYIANRLDTIVGAKAGELKNL